MRILLVNPPHTAIGSRIPDDQLPPLGLLSIGGSLVDAGYQVRLVDGDIAPMTLEQLRDETVAYRPLSKARPASKDNSIPAIQGEAVKQQTITLYQREG